MRFPTPSKLPDPMRALLARSALCLFFALVTQTSGAYAQFTETGRVSWGEWLRPLVAPGLLGLSICMNAGTGGTPGDWKGVSPMTRVVLPATLVLMLALAAVAI